jgi:hypothetical protein
MNEIVPLSKTEDPPAIESTATPEQQAEAEAIGWIPPNRFRGDPERFVDADQYIERGETVLPIVKDQNKKLQAKLTGLEQEFEKTQGALRGAQTKIAEIEERHVVDKQKAIEEAIAQTKSALVAASEAGDHEAVAELTNELVELNKPEEPVKPKPTERPGPAPFEPHPSMVAWEKENPWFGTDKRKTAVALAVADELRESGETAVNGPFFEMVSAEVNKIFGGSAPVPPAGKVEGGANGSGSDTRVTAAGGRGYSALPAEAKAACMAEAEDFVGEGKRYKTDAEWQARYAELYFQE